MHASDHKPLQVLNSLIGVNNNRLECYSFLEKETEVSVFKTLFGRLLETSHVCREELVREVYKLGGIPEEGTVPYFDFFKAWVDVKRAMSMKDHAGILTSCTFEEGVVLRSYETALKATFDGITTQHQLVFSKHYDILKSDQEKVINLRNVVVKSIQPDLCH